jgi:hypothetical protein
MNDRGASRKNPNKCRTARFSFNTTPLIKKKIKAIERQILDEYGSINEWMNALVVKDLAKWKNGE